ncbi:hypothetical protein ACFXA3_00300 [Streptomyces sp. NPDC059456]|uniref:hypothetical protein n=1 Tax=Streptomyces sp. NPDC059456 TaxID=3346838 RepID=UPI0036A0E904
MTAALIAQRRSIFVLAFLGLFAWVFGIDPPVWERLLIVALAALAVAATATLDGHRIRPAKTGHPPYDTAA